MFCCFSRALKRRAPHDNGHKKNVRRKKRKREKKNSLLRFVHANDSPFSLDAVLACTRTRSIFYPYDITNISRWKWKCTIFFLYALPHSSILIFVYVCLDFGISVYVRDDANRRIRCTNIVLIATLISSNETNREICPCRCSPTPPPSSPSLFHARKVRLD